MSIQTKIEQTAKEYLLYKDLLDKKKVEVEEAKKRISSLSTEDKDKYYSEVFDELGSLGFLGVDVGQIKVKLYHYIKLAEDFVEVPENIKMLVDDYTPQYLFTVDGEIANKKMYNQYKENYIAQAKQFGEIIKK